MEDYISRKAVVNARHNCDRNCKECDFARDGDSWCAGEIWVVDVLRIPTADVRPVVKGKWLKLSRGDVCSQCKYQTGRYEHGGNFCPNCGADMREESNG